MSNEITEQVIQQRMKKCIHFNEISSKVCKAGVSYESVRVNNTGAIFKIEYPCIGTGGFCDKCQFLTREQAIEEEKELLEMAANGLAMYVRVKDHHKKTGLMKATITCVCGGKLTYMVVQSNGHIRSHCEGCGQSFIE